MSSPFDICEEIWCINLDHRTDRRERAREQFKSVDILGRVKRFSGIKHADGRVGCIKSFISLLEYAKEKGLKNILIFEDDIKFINNPLENFKLALEQSVDLKWDMFYLGATVNTNLVKVKPNILLLKEAWAAHAIIYNNSVFDTIVNRFKDIKMLRSDHDIYDVYLREEVQNNFTCLLVNPLIATQFSDYSDVQRHDVDYSFIERNFKTYITEEI